MHASLIEVDYNLAPHLWYAGLAGRRLWCQEARELMGSDGWLVLPGQGLPDYCQLIFPEHGWVVREGAVELVLQELVGVARQSCLPLGERLS
jgi:hypothetical protein